jgi:hypothetical protein
VFQVRGLVKRDVVPRSSHDHSIDRICSDGFNVEPLYEAWTYYILDSTKAHASILHIQIYLPVSFFVPYWQGSNFHQTVWNKKYGFISFVIFLDDDIPVSFNGVYLFELNLSFYPLPANYSSLHGQDR